MSIQVQPGRPINKVLNGGAGSRAMLDITIVESSNCTGSAAVWHDTDDSDSLGELCRDRRLLEMRIQEFQAAHCEKVLRLQKVMTELKRLTVRSQYGAREEVKRIGGDSVSLVFAEAVSEVLAGIGSMGAFNGLDPQRMA